MGWRVRFLELECVRSSEAGGDELYLVVGPVSVVGGAAPERSIFYPDKPSLRRGERTRFRGPAAAAGPIDYRVSDAHRMIVVGLFQGTRKRPTTSSATTGSRGTRGWPRAPRPSRSRTAPGGRGQAAAPPALLFPRRDRRGDR